MRIHAGMPKWAAFALAACLLFPNGCSLFEKKPMRRVEQYTLDYAPPIPREPEPIPVVVKVNRFSAVRVFQGTSMMYSQHPPEMEEYIYYRWIAAPGDLAADFLFRDMVESGLFKAVLRYSSSEEAAYSIEGTIREFLEKDDKSDARALLAMDILLFDESQTSTARKIMFQKEYRFFGTKEAKTARGFARSMSNAMEQASEHILRDVYEAICAKNGHPDSRKTSCSGDSLGSADN